MTASAYGAPDKLSLAGGLMSGPLDSQSSISAGTVVLAWQAVLQPDASRGNHFRVTLTAGATTLNPPVNPQDGQKITFEVIQDTAGSRVLSFAAGFSFSPDTGVPQLTSTPGATDILAFVYSAGLVKWCCAGILHDYT